MIVQEMYVMVAILPKTLLSVDIRFSEHKAWFAVCITINSWEHNFLSSILTVLRRLKLT